MAHKKKPRQATLPQMEDRAIEELQRGGIEYAEVRDERMTLTKDEVARKVILLRLMKKHNKLSYAYDGVVITIVPGEETVKVRVRVRGKKTDEEE